MKEKLNYLMEKTPLDLLRGPPKALDIVVYLSEGDEEEVGNIMSNLDLSPSTFYSATEKLKLLGFLYQKREKGFPPRTYIALTNKGREAARLLRPLAEVVESTIQGLKMELQELEAKERTEDESKKMVKILKDLQDISFTLGEWHDAESHARRSMDIASALGDSNILSKSLRTLGRIHYKRGDHGDSESEFSNSLRISMKINDSDGAAEAHYFLGAIHEKRGEYDVPERTRSGELPVYCLYQDGFAQYLWNTTGRSPGIYKVYVLVRAWDYSQSPPDDLITKDKTTDPFTLS